MPRLNVSYLRDRVYNIRSEKSRQIRADYEEELKEARRVHLLQVEDVYDFTEFSKLQKKKARLMKQLEAIEADEKRLQGFFQVDFPYLFVHKGKPEFRSRSYGDSWTDPKDLVKEEERLKKDHDARQRACDKLIEKFLDSVMLGEATGDSLKELINQISDL